MSIATHRKLGRGPKVHGYRKESWWTRWERRTGNTVPEKLRVYTLRNKHYTDSLGATLKP